MAFDPYASPQHPAVGYQRWRDLLFLHWTIPVEVLRPRIPAGLEIDTYDGQAYLGLVPFFMDAVRPRFLPPVPGLSWFLELNIRTYVRDAEGRPGVWFFSLDCDNAVAVQIARAAFNLPYQHARMSAQRDPESLIRYQCQRKGQPSQTSLHYRPAPNSELKTASAGSLDHFLLERYLLFSQNRKGDLYWGQVHHPPYQYQPADVPVFDKKAFEWENFTLSGPPVSQLFSPGPAVTIHPLQPVAGA